MTAIERAVGLLHREGCSCVIINGEQVMLCHKRGVADLYGLLTGTPEVLLGAVVADKVVGKGAAALMALGGVISVHADVISRPALRLLEKESIDTRYNTLADNIINRTGTGICPVETLCRDAETPEECLPLITEFINNQS